MGDLTKCPKPLQPRCSNKAEAQTGQTLHKVMWQVLKDVESRRDDSWIPSWHPAPFRILSSLQGEIPRAWKLTLFTAIYKFPMGESHCWNPGLMRVKEYVCIRKINTKFAKERLYQGDIPNWYKCCCSHWRIRSPCRSQPLVHLCPSSLERVTLLTVHHSLLQNIAMESTMSLKVTGSNWSESGKRWSHYPRTASWQG